MCSSSLSFMNSCTGKEIVEFAICSAFGKSPFLYCKILLQVVNALALDNEFLHQFYF